jgi:hypothetical protein
MSPVLFVRRFALAALLALCLLAFASAPALAGQTRKLLNTFGSLSNPQGVAIDQSSGDVYVADTGNHRIEKFDALGNFLLAFGADVGGAGVNTCTSALTCVAGTPGSAPGQFTTAEFLAVDNDSASASFHDVYVADTADNKVSKFDSSGNLVATWGSGGQLDGSTTTAKTFGSLAGVAVDATGRLDVLNVENTVSFFFGSQLFEFGQDGSFASELELGEPFNRDNPAANGLAVDAAGSFFKVNEDKSVEKLDAAGKIIGKVSPGGPEVGGPLTPLAIAIEPVSGDLYVATAAPAINHYAFNGSGEVVEPGGSPPCNVAENLTQASGCGASDSVATPFAAAGIAVSSASGESYLSNPVAGQVSVYSAALPIPDVTTASASEVGPVGARLNGTVNPAGLEVTECRFEYVDQAGYQPEAPDPYASGATAPCAQTAAEIGTGSAPVEVHADVTGLTAGTTYHFRLRAGNLNGSSLTQDATLATLPPPSIDSATVASLTAESAQLEAKINPNGFHTTYHIEYGTTTAYGTRLPALPAPDPEIGEGSADVQVTQHAEGLHHDMTYHWRVVAANANGTTTSPDHTFIYDTSGEGLPDGRAYEMVTPAQKNGAVVGSVDFTGKPADVSPGGSRLIAGSIQCFASSESCNAVNNNGIGSPYAFTRTSGGWVTTPLAPSASLFAPHITPWDYNALTDTALFSMPTAPHGEDDLYVRHPDGTFVEIGPNTPPEDGPHGPVGGSAGNTASAQTPDFSHVVFEMPTAEVKWPFDETEFGSETVYEYVGVGKPRPLLVGVSGGQGSNDLLSTCGTRLGGGRDEPNGRMSGDGSTVYFTALLGYGAPCPGSGANKGTLVTADTVYARVDGESAAAHTVAISQPSPSECGGGVGLGEVACREAAGKPGDGLFEGASADGSKAFFTDTQQLTDGASQDSHSGDSASTIKNCQHTVGANGCNLYEYDFANPSGHHLIDVSAGDVSGGGPRVQGVVALSPDGSHVYFVAKGVLTTTANDQGQVALSGANNLYVFAAGRVAFIASLPSSDSRLWSLNAGVPANVTPEGRFLVFPSHGRLTADDTSVSGAKQVFRYDADSGALVRISVGNNGFNDNGNRSAPTPCGNVCSEDATIVQAAGSSRLDATMSDDGSYVFFESPVGLTPRALDDVQIGTDAQAQPIYAWNVYEWHAGHVHLISDGRDVSLNEAQEPRCTAGPVPSSVCLLGVDSSGANVFFSTVDPLVPQDTDTELDYYDARICTASDPCIGPPPATVVCHGDACQGTPGAQPPVPVAASVSFTGPGNASPGGSGAVSAAGIKVLSRVVHGSTFLLTVSVPGKGRIAITGAQLRTLRRTVTRAGTYRFAVSLKPRARSALRRRHTLGVRLRVGFAPAAGRASSALLTLTVKR